MGYIITIPAYKSRCYHEKNAVRSGRGCCGDVCFPVRMIAGQHYPLDVKITDARGAYGVL